MLLTVGAIAANVLAFVAIFSFLDAVCVWFFSLVQIEDFGLAVKKNNFIFKFNLHKEIENTKF